MKQLIILVFLLNPFFIYTQKSDKTITIGISDNNIIKGKLVKETKDSISVEVLDIGLITLDKENLLFINRSDFSNISSSKLKMYKVDYAATESAISPEKGSVFWDSKIILFNKVSFTPIKKISFEVGTLMPSETFISPYISVKYSHTFSENLHFAAKSFYFRIGSNQQTIFNNSIYATIGNLKNNFTFGYHRTNNSMEEYIFTTNQFEKIVDNFNVLSFAALVDITNKVDLRFEFINVSELTKFASINIGMNFKKICLTLGGNAYYNLKNPISSSANFIPFLAAKIPITTPNQ